MNKEAIELVKQYIGATVSGGNSISKDAYEILTHMLKADRTLATELYDTYDKIESSGLSYQIPVSYSDDELNDDDGYEH
jgi:hypothetical protein